MEREPPLRQKRRRSSHSSGVGVQNENRRLSTSPRDSRLLYSSHSFDHRRGDSGRDDSPLSSMGECGSRPSIQETSVEAEKQGSQEARHPTQGGEGQARTQYVQLAEGCTPISTYHQIYRSSFHGKMVINK